MTRQRLNYILEPYKLPACLLAVWLMILFTPWCSR